MSDGPENPNRGLTPNMRSAELAHARVLIRSDYEAYADALLTDLAAHTPDGMFHTEADLDCAIALRNRNSPYDLPAYIAGLLDSPHIQERLKTDAELRQIFETVMRLLLRYDLCVRAGLGVRLKPASRAKPRPAP